MTSPSIMGIMAANRIFLVEIGALDGGMLGYGGENVELSLRLWSRDGSLTVEGGNSSVDRELKEQEMRAANSEWT
ncbi:hypothetical protein U0070_017742 [Myodes glareolus]|uniref:MHC class I antigen n=1 Tax=Myodes glareolus TaxID=447135 RepID=A0AAW0HTN0_MYOGA